MKFSSKKGFTLIELLVVVAIIGVLASIILSALGDARAKARDARRDSDIKSIQNALEMYYLENGQYPTTSWVYSNNPASWTNFESYLGKLPIDPVNETASSHLEIVNPPYKLGYSYFGHVSPIHCAGQGYMLVYNKETEIGNGPNDGVTLCDGTFRAYGNAFVVGLSPLQ